MCFPFWSELGFQGGLDQNRAQELLLRCPNLVRCRLRATSSTPFSPGPNVTLEYLTVLILEESFDPVQFIQGLVLPRLHYLGIGEDDSRPSLRCVESSSQKLTVQHANAYLLPQNSILELLKLLPEVSCIRVQDNCEPLLDDQFLDDQFLARLSPAPDGTVCPALTHIQVDTSLFSDAALFNFIRAKMAMDHPLQCFEVGVFRTMEVDIVQELKPYSFEGLHIDVRYLPSSPPWQLDAREGLFDVGF